MSKLAKLIDYTITGDRKANSVNMLYTKAELQTGDVTREFGVARAVKIGVTFNQVVYIDEYELHKNNNAVTDAMKIIKRAMVEEIFGEFRPLILDAAAATYDADLIRLRNVMAKLEQEMFYDGI